MPSDWWEKTLRASGQFLTAFWEQRVPCEGCRRVFMRKDMAPLIDLPQYSTWLGLFLPFCPDCQANLRALHNYRGMCQRENRVVATQVRRAMQKGNPATLTLKQWLQTLDRFAWRCAYCQNGAYEALEHFKPIELGGGTTVDNCVPACTRCNSSKGVLHPDSIGKSSRDSTAIADVRAYLATQIPTSPSLRKPGEI